MSYSRRHTLAVANKTAQLVRERRQPDDPVDYQAELAALRDRIESNSALLRGIAMAFAISAGVGCIVFAVLLRIGAI